MPRLDRRSAAAEVARAAEALSDSTLDLEEQAFDRIEEVYLLLALAIAKEIEEADSTEANAALWVTIAVLISATIPVIVGIVAELIADAMIEVSETLREELEFVERTLAAKYGGTAAQAMTRVPTDDIAADAVDRFYERLDTITERMDQRVQDEIRDWRLNREGRQELIDRLTLDVPGESRGVVLSPIPSAKAKAREASIEAENQTRESAFSEFNEETKTRGSVDPVIYKQVLATIDSRTTVVCLHAAGQIQPLDQPFDTLNGPVDRPPFHWGCRSLIIPWLPGMVQPYRDEANRELLSRPLRERRLGPDGEIGGEVPGLPPPLREEPLPSFLAENPDLPIDLVPGEHRIAYMRANPERFSIYATGNESWWVRDSGGRRWNLRR